MELAIAFITGVLGPLLVIYIKYLLDKRKPKPDMVTEALRVGELDQERGTGDGRSQAAAIKTDLETLK